MSAPATPLTTGAVPPRWKSDSALVTTALLWGTTFVVVQAAIRSISTMYFLALRFGLAALCLAFLFHGPLRRASGRQIWRGLRGGGIAGIALWLGYAFQTYGLKYTTAGNSGFITGLYVVLVPLISAAIYRRWPRPIEIMGILIAAGGMTVLTLPSLARNLHVNRGDGLTVMCAVCYAFHLLLVGYFSQREVFEFVAIGQVAATALFSSAALFWEKPEASWSIPLVLAIVGTSVFATGLTFSLQTWAQQFTSATRAALIFALEPVFALATAVLAREEALTLYSVAGGCLILAGIVLVELKPGRL